MKVSNIIINYLSSYKKDQEPIQGTKLAKHDTAVVDMQWEIASKANNSNSVHTIENGHIISNNLYITH